MTPKIEKFKYFFVQVQAEESITTLHHSKAGYKFDSMKEAQRFLEQQKLNDSNQNYRVVKNTENLQIFNWQ